MGVSQGVFQLISDQVGHTDNCVICSMPHPVCILEGIQMWGQARFNKVYDKSMLL